MKSLVAGVILMALTTAGLGGSGTGAIEGRVLSLFGEPVPDARVEAAGKAVNAIVAQTDSQGWYRFFGLAEGDYRITVASRAFGREERSVFLKTAEKLHLDFGLAVAKTFDMDPCEIGGVVRNHTRGVQDATVVAVAALNSRLRVTAQSDCDGRYLLRIADPGQYVVYAYKPGLGVRSEAITLSADISRPRATLDFDLEQTGR